MDVRIRMLDGLVSTHCISDTSFLGKLLVLPANVKIRLESDCQLQTLAYLAWSLGKKF